MRKSADTQIKLAHMKIKACIENNQNENECVPGPPVTNALSETGLVNKHRRIMCISRNRVNQTHLANESISQSIMKSHM